VTDSIDDLLRSTRMHYGHIQLFRDDQGWQASVYHYEPKRLTHDGKVSDDPVAALRAALIEDERRSRDLERRYAQSAKVGDTVFRGVVDLGDGEGPQDSLVRTDTVVGTITLDESVDFGSMFE